jgi:hypothetical protein
VYNGVKWFPGQIIGHPDLDKEGRMLKAVNKILVLSLVLVLSLTFFGCAEGKLSEEEIDLIAAKAATATTEVDTVRFDMDMLMTIEMIGVQPGGITVVVDGSATIDNADREMQMLMNMNTELPGEGELETVMDLYIIGEWLYMKIDIPGAGEQWLKMELTEEMWEMQNQIEPQIEMLQSAVEVNLLGSEDVNGTPCYVVEIIPSMEALSDLLAQQQTPGMEDLDFGELNLTDLFEKMSIIEWVAKDSYLLMKSEINMLMELSAEDVGATQGDFEKMTMDMNMEMILYDYNQAVSIELPQEALKALEMPGS